MLTGIQLLAFNGCIQGQYFHDSAPNLGQTINARLACVILLNLLKIYVQCKLFFFFSTLAFPSIPLPFQKLYCEQRNK